MKPFGSHQLLYLHGPPYCVRPTGFENLEVNLRVGIFPVLGTILAMNGLLVARHARPEHHKRHSRPIPSRKAEQKAWLFSWNT